LRVVATCTMLQGSRQARFSLQHDVPHQMALAIAGGGHSLHVVGIVPCQMTNQIEQIIAM
jgi:hypothetical protein